MSRVSTLEGGVVYDSEETRDAVLEKLREEGWDSNNIYPRSRTVDGEMRWIIHIRNGIYRNLGHHLELLFDDAVDYGVVEYCTDGTLEGNVYTTESTEEYDIDEWISDTHPSIADSKPEKAEFDTEDDWFGEYTSWLATVEHHFFNWHQLSPHQSEREQQADSADAAA